MENDLRDQPSAALTSKRSGHLTSASEQGSDSGVTILLPAYNEEAGLAGQLEQLISVMNEAGTKYEIIVIDDGSTDRTAEIAAEYPVRLIRQNENRGYGAALKRGAHDARTEWIVTIDADGTYPSSAIPALLERTGDCDMVVGARIGETVHIPLVRRPAKAFLRAFASYVSGQNIPDLNSGLRIVKKSLVMRFENILSTRFSFSTTLTLSLICAGFAVEYVPIDYHKREGKSKIRPKDAGTFFVQIIRTASLFNPLRVFVPVGVAIFIVGCAKIAYDVSFGNFSDSAITGILAGLIIVMMGILADLIVRISYGLGGR